jgi:predicted branched-subunit amino acid permease
MLQPRGVWRWLAAQVAVDEPTAVAIAQTRPESQRRGFWLTGGLIYFGWNLTTLLGALLGNALGDPRRYGLDGAAPAAFLALLWPRLRGRRLVAVAVACTLTAALLVPLAPAGVPVVAAGCLAGVIALSRGAEP